MSVSRTSAWWRARRAIYYKGVASLRTTISCRLIAPLIVPVAVAAGAGQAAGPPDTVVDRLPLTPRARVILAAPPAHSPVMSDGVIYVVLRTGTLAAYRGMDGAESWRVEIEAEQPLAAAGGLVLVASGGAVHALRGADGRVAWRTPVGTVTAAPVAHDGWGIAVTGVELVALRLADGSVVWRQPRTDVDALSGRPSVTTERVYLPLSDGRLEARALATGAIDWTLRLDAAPSEILAAGDRLYVGSADGYFYCLAAADGAVKWRYRLGAATRGLPAIEGSRVFVVALDHLARAFDSGNGGRQWNKGVPYRPAAGPLVAGGTVLVAGPAAELVTFDAVSGQPGPRMPLGGVLQGVPATGTIGQEQLLAAITGDLASGWTLAIFDSSYAIPLAPLTALPGEVVPITIPTR